MLPDMKKETATEIITPILSFMVEEMMKNDSHLNLSEIYSLTENNVPLSDYAKETTSSGGQRWRNILQFYSIELAVAGFILKQKGVWYLTDEGQSVYKAGGAKYMLSTAHSKYREFEKSKKSVEITPDNPYEEPYSAAVSNIDELTSNAMSGIRDYIVSKNPYEFQFLVAALLRAMGYFTPFVAPKGKDGGIDIIAYNDPLGTIQPHIKVQVKHYPNAPISVEVIRSLMGVLNKDSEVGMIVTSGSFTSEAIREARHARRHLRLIDINEFISLWETYYDKMPYEDRALLPITPIYFLDV